ncbi:MAG: glycerophosphodiester phosphodiesterase [Phycisphaerales bacterium]
MADSIQIIAHRGSSFTAPENTKASIMLAYQQGAHAAECDVYLTKDNKIMLMHDKSVKRTGGIDVNMADANSDTLAKIDIGSWKDPNYKNEKIPFLKDIISSIPPQKKLVIEIKSGTEILPYLEDVINKTGKRKQLEIIAFNFDVAKGSKKLMPDIPVYWLISTAKDPNTDKPLPHNMEYISKVKAAGLDGIDAHYAGVTKQFADNIHALGMKLYVWTVDDISVAQNMKEMGVDGITTNKPDIMLAMDNQSPDR